ncbi:MAG TPA: GWxTD domain-containing protein [Thermoanaerobaculia bacterium]|nr:GWxTD domain-containing protein [Thermoanaerobaculia bacterium]
MRRIAPVLAFLLFACLSLAETVPELFTRAKEQIKSASWSDALKTLDALETEAARPGNESVRAQLPAPLAFYRGVAHANLGQTEQAVAEFGAFLALQPNAQLDATQYSKKAAAAFENARKAGTDRSPSLADAYKSFQPRADAAARYPSDPTWADGPVRWIMSDAEKAEWSSLGPAGDRLGFVEKFWSSRPASFRTEFDRRVAFADESLADEPEQPGSLTDRGMVFILMGPPTFAGRKPLRNGEDTSDNAGLDTFGSQDEKNSLKELYASRGGKPPGWKVAENSVKYANPNRKAAESNENRMEVWHYRRELLPKGVPYQQVDFDFVTKQGYGINTLQRDPQPVATLGAAKEAAAAKP